MRQFLLHNKLKILVAYNNKCFFSLLMEPRLSVALLGSDGLQATGWVHDCSTGLAALPAATQAIVSSRRTAMAEAEHPSRASGAVKGLCRHHIYSHLIGWSKSRGFSLPRSWAGPHGRRGEGRNGNGNPALHPALAHSPSLVNLTNLRKALWNAEGSDGPGAAQGM